MSVMWVLRNWLLECVGIRVGLNKIILRSVGLMKSVAHNLVIATPSSVDRLVSLTRISRVVRWMVHRNPTLIDVLVLLKWVLPMNVSHISRWSLNRDVASCGFVHSLNIPSATKGRLVNFLLRGLVLSISSLCWIVVARVSIALKIARLI